MNIMFYIAGAVAVAATVVTVTRLNVVHALLYLVISLLAVAVVFYTLGAPFVAALEVIIYAGAIMVLFVFVVMLLNLGKAEARTESGLLKPSMWIGPGVLAAILIAELIYLVTAGTGGAYPAGMVAAQQVGMALFGPYLLGVELASMLLLAGLVAAYHLGWRKPSRTEVR
ncbi:MAG TPA: NADH-quinone oxidoreductase subunit J [Bryobacteraceae bacterium]|nr:NADH-quinone oxidoreductase subunit J [Bryobacteraceae bacterium]